MQPFSISVKEEIISNLNSRAKCDACILGMLLFCKKLSGKNIQIITESEKTASFFASNLSRICGIEISPDCNFQRKRKVYIVDIDDAYAIRTVFEYFSLDIEAVHQRFTKDVSPKKKLIPSVISGAFLVSGSVNDPSKESHLEFVVPTLDLCNDLGITLIEECGVTAKQMTRGKNEIVYLKDSESIQDILIYIGAQISALKHITVKVDKEGNNHLNRSINCTSANLKKSGAASAKQVDAIETLKSFGTLDELPQQLIDVARARLDNPDMSLSELCETIGGGITKSSLNRRLNKLITLAQEIKKS